MHCVKGGSHVDPDELALSKLDNSTLLYGRDVLHLVIAAFELTLSLRTARTRMAFS
jgi:hypothetical protein